MPHLHRALHLTAPQVEVPVFQPQFLIDPGGLGDLKRRGRAPAENPQVLDIKFNFAGGDLFVDRLPPPDGAFCHQHKFRTRGLCLGAQLRIGLVVERQL